MTISRVNGAGWGTGDTLTSAQANGLDLNGTYAADKRSAQTDTIEAVWTLTGAGRIIRTVALGADANTTYLVSGANLCIRVTSAVTASRTYTLSNTDAAAGDEIIVYCEASFASTEILIKDASANILFSLGNQDANDGQWASFVFTGAAWVLFRGGQGSRTRVASFVVSGSFVCPRGVTKAKVLGVGAGAGGGGGGGTAGTYGAGSGSGGGGALLGEGAVTMTPGTTYTVTLGTGGAGGTAGVGAAAGGGGVNGGDSTFDALATFYGAGGGVGGVLGAVNIDYSLGGPPSRHAYSGNAQRATGYDLPKLPGTGGVGYRQIGAAGTGTVPNSVSRAGQATGVAVGGATGANGANNGAGFGGGGGGGGGASGWIGGTGGAGGAGGTGNDGTNGTNGSVGSVGVLGGGGGGGGGGGTGTIVTNGGTGGAGGDGAIIVLYTK